MSLPLTPEVVVASVMVPVALKCIDYYLSKRKTREQEVYVPAYNEVRKHVDSLRYNQETGRFELMWESLEPQVKRGIKEEHRGPFILLDGDIHQLNRFLTNYRLYLESKVEESDYLHHGDDTYLFDVGGEIGRVPLKEFIDHFGSTIVTTKDRDDLWKHLQWGAPRNGYYSSINQWETQGGRIQLLWEARQQTHLNDPSMVQAPDEVYNTALEYADMAEDFLTSKISHLD